MMQSVLLLLFFIEIKMKIQKIKDPELYQNLQTQLNPQTKPPNPNYEGQGFAVENGGKTLATCWLYENPDLIFEGKPAAAFGNFEATDDAPAVQKLIAAAADFAKSKGKKYLLGPMNGSTWDSYRLAISNPDFRYLLDLHHPSFYPKLLEQAGLASLRDYSTNLDERMQFDRPRAVRREQHFQKMGIAFRQINLDDYEQELRAIHRFCLHSFADNFLFTPISFEIFREKYLPLRPFLDSKFILLAEGSAGELVGLMFAVPNLVDRSRRGLVIKTVARNLAGKFAGLGSVLGMKLYDCAREVGFDYLLHAFMEQSNVSRNVSAAFSGVEVKRYRLFFRTI